MADPVLAIRRTLEKEGKYSDHPKDPGGETVWGIARKKNPAWEYWPQWDRLKARLGTAKAADEAEVLKAVGLWYETEPTGPWVQIRGAYITSQWIADELFDTATNTGAGVAAGFLQRTLNALNRSDLGAGQLWEQLEVKGGIGPKTLAALRTALTRGFGPTIWQYLNALQGAFYISLAEKDPRFEAFVRGWALRVFERNLSEFR